jgi:hypothetical protein
VKFNPVRFLLLCALVMATHADAQQLLDRVLARVDSAVITLSDARAAIGLGVVESPSPEPDAAAVQQLIDRQVLLVEVGRFPSPEPAAEAVDALAATLRARAGNRLDALMRATGIDEARVREMARDTLRIDAYVRQRFGATATLQQADVRQWLRDVRGRAAIAEVTP